MKLKLVTIKALSLCLLINSCSSDEELENTINTNDTQKLKINNLNLTQNPPVLYDDLPTKEDDDRLGEFVLQGNKWNTNNLTYYYKNGTPDIISNNERNAIREAFNLWTEVTPLTFTETLNPNADIIIAFEEGDHGDGSNFDGNGGVLAHAFFPPPNSGSLAGDMHFDESETWTISLRPSSLSPRDIITVAAHEIGHSLGLRHSDVPGALMFPFYEGSHRFLDNDDIEGIQSIYGSPNSPFTTLWNNNDHVRTLADVNGDGKDDIVGFGNSSVYVSLSNGSGFGSAQIWTNAYTSVWNNNDHVRTLADVNGDGKNDIVGFGNSSVYVSLSNGSGFGSAQIWTNAYTSVWNNNDHVRTLADVNGDGKDDIVGFGNSSVYVSLSNGSGFGSAQIWTNAFTSVWNNNDHVRTLADVNGNGKNDIVGFGNTNVFISLSSGSNFETADIAF